MSIRCFFGKHYWEYTKWKKVPLGLSLGEYLVFSFVKCKMCGKEDSRIVPVSKAFYTTIKDTI